MHGSQLVRLHVLYTGEKLQRTHLEERNLTPLSRHVESMNERMHEERSRDVPERVEGGTGLKKGEKC